MSADPIYDGVKEGFGLYTYCRNNPLIYHDPSGLASENKNKMSSNEQARRMEAFIKAKEDFVKKYQHDQPEEGGQTPIKSEQYRISDGNNPDHKRRTMHQGKNNEFVSDYAAPEGTVVYTTGEITFETDAQGWSGGKCENTKKEFKNNNKEVILTVYTNGEDYGFRIIGAIDSGKKEVIYAHGNPNSEVAKEFLNLQSLAKQAGLKTFSLPQGVQIMEIGMTGLTSGPHLHYEINKIMP